MLLQTYQYGSERRAGEGLRIGVARHLPRGIRRERWAAEGYFDLWLPLLSPPPDLVKEYLKGSLPFPVFARRYQTAMKTTECRQVIRLLAGVCLATPVSIGCFCQEENRCHRSLLRKLILADRPGA